MTARIYRYEVPVDDEWHTIRNVSPALHVACRDPGVVEFWAHPVEQSVRVRAFRVYGTGHDIPREATYVGTALAPSGGLVWHLMAKWVAA